MQKICNKRNFTNNKKILSGVLTCNVMKGEFK